MKSEHKNACIQARELYFVHEGGTKDYNLVLVTSVTSHNAFLLKRWGKKRSAGQWNATFDVRSIIEKEFELEVKRRINRDYQKFGDDERSDKLENFYWHRIPEKLAATKWSDFLDGAVGLHDDPSKVHEDDDEPAIMRSEGLVEESLEEWGTW